MRFHEARPCSVRIGEAVIDDTLWRRDERKNKNVTIPWIANGIQIQTAPYCARCNDSRLHSPFTSRALL